MQKQTPLKKWLMLISLGFMGGTFYMSAYAGGTYYTQLVTALDMTNTQYGLAKTICSPIGIILLVPGAFLGDKFDAKKTLLFSIGSQSILNLSWPLWVHSFTTYVAWRVIYTVITIAYWGALIKYINNLDGEDSAGSSFTTYYLINGISGAVGSFIPLWVSNALNAGIGTIIFVEGVITSVATILIALFLDDEKKLAERGIYLKGDDPIQVKHIFYLLKYPGFWMMFVAYGAGVSLYNYVEYFTPYLTNVYDMDPSLSSTLAIIRQYGVNLVAPIGGYICDKVLKATYKWYIIGFGIVGVMYLAMTVTSLPWSFRRLSFPWAGEREEVKDLRLCLSQRAASFTVGRFRGAKPGLEVPFTHPETGREYTLTVLETEEQELPEHHAQEKGYEYPRRCLAMSYTVALDLPAIQVRDCGEGDRPRKQTPDGSVAVFSSAVGVLVRQGKAGEACSAVSALYFDLPREVEWRIVLHEKTAEDVGINLLP